MVQLRVATFNVENFDGTGPTERPSLAERVAVMRPQIDRLRADVVCFQEVHGQERAGQPRALHALAELLRGTNLEGAAMTSTRPQGDAVYDQRNLVVVSHLPVLHVEQLRNQLVAPLTYRRLTAVPPDQTAVVIGIERPVLLVELGLPDGGTMHVVNVHLKSKLPTEIPGQKVDGFTWRTADGWAEGTYLSSMKRMSQALEVRRLVDRILDAGRDARIVVAGDYNAEPDEITVLAIRGDVENTGNPDLVGRVLVPIEQTIPEPARYTLFHQGRGQMLDHMLVTRNLLAHYRGSEIHNEILHDESAAFAVDRKYPESDHAPVVATFDFP
ncbi:endonuclease/exonuclease/phosphatase family protein [Cellulomonas fimi]|uniref:Endonuclease n=1 Tax=Cellulomonas fimi TaxID=1708 RepID=A0A7Y0LZM5_CELFI|nr:endonuclease/exonuclease/phosphatase family protein [Cellulomonas fimi]NMR21162.1 endonuclease [Cellulomonas fimi]